VTKGKQARLDVGPPLTSTAPHPVFAQPWFTTELDDDQVAYSAILDSVPSESSSSSSGETSGSESILPLPPSMPNLHISVELSPMMEVPEAEVANQRIPVEAGAHMVLHPKVCYLSFHKFCMSFMIIVDLTFGHAGVCEDVDTRAGSRQVL
jgi:hypothetical protein